MKKLFIYLIIIVHSINYSIAQEKDTITMDDFYIDYSVPDIGAFTLLNLKPEQITTPGNPKELSASFLNIVSGQSYLTPGIAIDWAPFQTFKKTISSNQYQRHYLLRNIQLTLGTVADSAGTKAAMGFKWTFIDKTDPLLDKENNRHLIDLNLQMRRQDISNTSQFAKMYDLVLKNIDSVKMMNGALAVDSALNSFLELNDTIRVNTDVFILSDSLTRMINTFIVSKHGPGAVLLSPKEESRVFELCRTFKITSEFKEAYLLKTTEDFLKAKKDWKKRHWNATVVSAGFGEVWNSLDNKWESLRGQFYKTYFNAKFPIQRWAQISSIVSYSVPQTPNIKTDSTTLSHLFAGGRFLMGNADNRFSIDLGYRFSETEVSTYNNKNLSVNLGFEIKLNEGIFLEIACGINGKPNELFKSGNILSLGALKYSFNKDRRFDIN